MMIVFNASTLILLAKAELLEGFLESVGPQVVIPKEVERECTGARRSPDALLIQKAVSEKKIKVIAIRNQRLCEKIQGDFPLARGEAEAVTLAVSEKAGLLAIDDKQGINACKLLRIPFTTAVDILVRMREKGLVEREEALIKLEALQRYGRYKTWILKDARSRLEGNR